MTEILDGYDRRLARTATGELADLNAAGILEAADVHVATRLAELVDESDPLARVTLALTVRAAREGSTSMAPEHARELLAAGSTTGDSGAQGGTEAGGGTARDGESEGDGESESDGVTESDGGT